MRAGVISLYGPRDHVLAELNAQQPPVQKPAMPAPVGASVTSVETSKGNGNDPYDAQPSN